MDFLPFWGKKGGIEKKRHWGGIEFSHRLNFDHWRCGVAEQQSQRILDGAIFIIICMEKRRVSSAASLLNNLDPPPGKKTSVDDVEPPLPAGLWYTLYRIIDSSSRGMGICWPRHKRTRQERGNEIKGRRKKGSHPTEKLGQFYSGERGINVF